MQDKKQFDDYKTKADKNEPFQEQYLPTSYDWRLSNCDERRSTPCRQIDHIRHNFHHNQDELSDYVLVRLELARAKALARYRTTYG
jgi:hypothetical protein